MYAFYEKTCNNTFDNWTCKSISWTKKNSALYCSADADSSAEHLSTSNNYTIQNINDQSLSIDETPRAYGIDSIVNRAPRRIIHRGFGRFNGLPSCESQQRSPLFWLLSLSVKRASGINRIIIYTAKRRDRSFPRANCSRENFIPWKKSCWIMRANSLCVCTLPRDNLQKLHGNRFYE